MDSHVILGVDRSADDAAIKRAYKALCLKYHPDKNLGDATAAERFKQVQQAYLTLASNSIGGDNATRAEACREAVEALKAAAMGESSATGKGGATCLKIGDGILFLGATEAGLPHGDGDLLLKDGSVHAGTFKAGRAEGAGVLYSANGTVFSGSWHLNKRFGEFDVIDPKGGRWKDAYDEAGKRTRRTKAAAAPEAAAAVAPHAAACTRCRAKFHGSHNSKCRRHKGKWMVMPAPVDWTQFPEGGMHLCCGSLVREGGEGCFIAQSHEVEQVEPVAEEMRIEALDLNLDAAAAPAPEVAPVAPMVD